MASQNVSLPESDHLLVGVQRTEAAMSRRLVWIEQDRFRGFGCSECGWRFQKFWKAHRHNFR